jgi:hypothetical protein
MSVLREDILDVTTPGKVLCDTQLRRPITNATYRGVRAPRIWVARGRLCHHVGPYGEEPGRSTPPSAPLYRRLHHSKGRKVGGTGEPRGELDAWGRGLVVPPFFTKETTRLYREGA